MPVAGSSRSTVPGDARPGRGRLARFGDRVEFVEADLRGPLPIDEPVDAILSTATFHWIRDHAACTVISLP